MSIASSMPYDSTLAIAIEGRSVLSAYYTSFMAIFIYLFIFIY